MKRGVIFRPNSRVLNFITYWAYIHQRAMMHRRQLNRGQSLQIRPSLDINQFVDSSSATR